MKVALMITATFLVAVFFFVVNLNSVFAQAAVRDSNPVVPGSSAQASPAVPQAVVNAAPALPQVQASNIDSSNSISSKTASTSVDSSATNLAYQIQQLQLTQRKGLIIGSSALSL